MTRPEADDRRREAVGLCLDCAWHRQVRSGKGSEFFYCRRSETDPAYERYPRLPVVSCPGYEPEA